MKYFFLLFIALPLFFLPAHSAHGQVVDVGEVIGNVGHIDGVSDILDQTQIVIDGQVLSGTEDIFRAGGSIAGGAIGCAFGPLGCVIGANIGDLVGRFIGGLFGGGPDIEDLFQNKEYKEGPRERKKAADLHRQMQENILNIIRTGRNGKPTWVQNWHHFVRDQEDNGRKQFRVQIYDAALGPNATICAYLADDIANRFRAQENDITFNGRSNEYMRIGAEQPFNVRNRCTLPEDYNDADYMSGKSFTLDLFLARLQPQNDPTSLWLNSVAERNNQAIAQAETARESAVANGGNLGLEGDPDGLQTPGSILNQVGAAAITSDLNWYVSSDEIGEVIYDANGRLQARLGALSLSGGEGDEKVQSEREPVGGSKRLMIQLIANAVAAGIGQQKIDQLQESVNRVEQNTRPAASPQQTTP